MSDQSEEPHRRPPTADRSRPGPGTWGMIILALAVLAAILFWAAGNSPR